MSKIKRLAAEILVLVVKIFSLIKNIVVSLGSLFLLRPSKSVLRLIFYKFVVKVYALYYSTAKRLGWVGRNANGFILSKEFGHIFIVILVLAVVLTNAFAPSRAYSQSSLNEKNILSRLVKAEFGDQIQSVLIEEGAITETALEPAAANNYFDSLANLQAPNRIERVLTPEEEIEIFVDPGSFDPSFIRPGHIKNDTAIARHETIVYTVEDGDTISTIAEKFGLTVSTILWENDLDATSVIRPGDSLRILPMSGVVHQVAKGESLQSLANNFGVADKSIAEANSLGVNDTLLVGQKLLIPGGRKKQYASFTPKVYSGVSVVRDIISPVKGLIKSRKSSTAAKAGNRMTWPTVGYRISQYYSFRHFAIDVANRVGTPLYAADTGVVEFAGWSTGYGNNIVINHGGGKKTRYAHASKMYVTKGEVVSKGEQIAAMGSTGWSTGSHIHFEVIINGVKYNPLNYVH